MLAALLGSVWGAVLLLVAFFCGRAIGRGERRVAFVPRRFGVWATPSALNTFGPPACWHRQSIVVAYETRDEASAEGARMEKGNDMWTAEVRVLPSDVEAVPRRLLASRT